MRCKAGEAMLVMESSGEARNGVVAQEWSGS
jgi:hypothetical protein